MTTHTPGPWTVSETRSGDGAVWLRVDMGHLAPAAGLSGPHTPVARAELSGATTKANAITLRANARLIAAAPDLLAALELAVTTIIRTDELVQTLRAIGGVDAPALREVLQFCRAAIAKAEGEA